MDLAKTKEKWEAYYQAANLHFPLTAEVLKEHHYLLPESGLALDLACDLGGNALLLANSGMQTDAWDISVTAVTRLKSLATAKKLSINAEVKEIDDNSLSATHYDVIVVSRFLDRTLSDFILRALNSGGLLFYQTYTVEKISNQGPNSLEYLLSPNELLKLFKSLRVLFFKDFGKVGDVNTGFRNESEFIGQKWP